MRKKLLLLAMASAALSLGSVVPPRVEPVRKSPRPCLNCGVAHKHNNSFCSGECCKEWQEIEREGREKMKLKYDGIEIELTGKSIGLEQFAKAVNKLKQLKGEYYANNTK